MGIGNWYVREGELEVRRSCDGLFPPPARTCNRLYLLVASVLYVVRPKRLIRRVISLFSETKCHTSHLTLPGTNVGKHPVPLSPDGLTRANTGDST